MLLKCEETQDIWRHLSDLPEATSVTAFTEMFLSLTLQVNNEVPCLFDVAISALIRLVRVFSHRTLTTHGCL